MKQPTLIDAIKEAARISARANIRGQTATQRECDYLAVMLGKLDDTGTGAQVYWDAYAKERALYKSPLTGQEIETDDLKLYTWKDDTWPAYKIYLGVAIAHNETEARELLAQEAFPVRMFDEAEPPILPTIYPIKPVAVEISWFSDD